MVLDFYNLREQPFGSTPDTRYLFASETHREALASLLYGIKTGRGFIALIASPGMGKTTLLFRSLSQLKDTARTVFLFQTISTPLGLLQALLRDLGETDVDGDLVELQNKLTRIVTEQSKSGQQLIVVIDEAQNLDDSVLELVRMLSNFETSKEKLMQIVLAGQPQLAKKLASPELLQLRQRISIVAQLTPFTPDEAAEYVIHRLRVAGYAAETPLFTQAALNAIAQYSQGIPRNINTVCFNALSIGAVLKRRVIDADVVREVVADLDLEPMGGGPVPLNPSLNSAYSNAPIHVPLSSRAYIEPDRRWPGFLVSAALLILLAVSAFSAASPSTVLAVLSPASSVAQSGPQHIVMPGIAADRSLSTTPDILPLEEVAITSDDPGPVVTLPEMALHTGRGPGTRQLAAVTRPGSRAPHQDQRAHGSAVYQDEVLVRPGMTLYTICADAFNSCNFQQIQTLRHLNPWLGDSNRVEVGDVVLLPSRPRSQRAERSSAILPSGTSAREAQEQ